MQRRHALALTVLSAGAMATAWGIATWSPGLRDRRLTPSARQLLGVVAICILDGVQPAMTEVDLHSHLNRMDQLLSALPAGTRAEISDLLGILSMAPGRWALAALSTPWSSASQQSVGDALQGMRTSRVMVQRQAYQALRELTLATHFSQSASWSSLGYPGPKPL